MGVFFFSLPVARISNIFSKQFIHGASKYTVSRQASSKHRGWGYFLPALCIMYILVSSEQYAHAFFSESTGSIIFVQQLRTLNRSSILCITLDCERVVVHATFKNPPCHYIMGFENCMWGHSIPTIKNKSCILVYISHFSW